MSARARGMNHRWDTLPVSRVAAVNPPTVVPSRDFDHQQVPLYEMASIDEYAGTLRDPMLVPLRTCRSGRTKFQTADVLFAKITPCVQNGKSALVSRLEGDVAFGSSEFYVLRAGKRVMPEYLFYFIRQNKVREAAVGSFTGTSGRQRVPKGFWDTLNLPLPPLPVQERIVQILQKADETRRKRQEAVQLAAVVRGALFTETFGQLGSNPSKWPLGPLNDLLDPAIERINPTIALADRDFIYIEIAGIRDFRIAQTKRIAGPEAPSRARQVVREGDVLYSMTRPNLRNIAVVPKELDGAICTTGFAVLRPRIRDDAAFVFEMVKSDHFTEAMSRLNHRARTRGAL